MQSVDPPFLLRNDDEEVGRKMILVSCPRLICLLGSSLFISLLYTVYRSCAWVRTNEGICWSQRRCERFQARPKRVLDVI